MDRFISSFPLNHYDFKKTLIFDLFLEFQIVIFLLSNLPLQKLDEKSDRMFPIEVYFKSNHIQLRFSPSSHALLYLQVFAILETEPLSYLYTNGNNLLYIHK